MVDPPHTDRDGLAVLMFDEHFSVQTALGFYPLCLIQPATATRLAGVV